MADLLSRLQAALADRYTIERELGRGGMATVYLAQDPKHHRRVAVKVLRPELAAALGAQRFLREIEIAARLTHPHILPLHDSGEAEGFLFYVMPYVEGESLRDRLAREIQLPVDDALVITRELADALGYAHSEGVVHRDIKPENILLAGGHALLADFGIAKAVSEAGDTKLTETGLVVGTAAYMSPEQSTGSGRLDGRSDLYSLGCVFYEMLVGEPPYTGPTAEAIIARRLTDPFRPVRTVRASVPEHVERVLERVLAKVPADRFATAAQFVAALEAPAVLSPELHSPGPGDAIAVFDFANLSGDPSLDWLSSGIAETVTVDLKRVPGLRIISRDKVLRAQAEAGQGGVSEANLARVGRQLGARWVVWGGFQTFGRSIRITPQFREMETDELVSATKIDGPLDEIFTLQDRIVTNLMEALRIEVPAPALEQIGKPETVQLQAYECYAKGRQAFSRFEPAGFEAAREYFEQATAIDPDYALAYSGLGSVFAFRYIATTDPGDLELAVQHLQKAIALDPNLGTPHVWLSYAYTRQHRFDDAREAGRRAVELEPDDPNAHYFLGVSLLTPGFKESHLDPDVLAGAVGPLVRSIQLEPAYHPGDLVLGDLYMVMGQYDVARVLFERAVKIEETGKFKEVRFVGALTMRAWLHVRENQLDEALQRFTRSLDLLGRATHVYGEAFKALTHCGMGEVAYRQGAYDLAIEHHTRARELVDKSPHRLGVGYFLIKALLGLARAFHRLRMRREEEAHLAAALELLRGKEGYNFQWMWEASEVQAWYDCSAYYAGAGRRGDCLAWLRKAVDAGWRDRGLVEGNEDFRTFAGDPEFEVIRRVLAAGPGLPEDPLQLLAGLRTPAGVQ